MLSTKSKGFYLALITSVISGVSIFVNKFAVDAITPPLFFTATKNLMVGLLVVGVVVALGKWRLITKLKRAEVAALLLVGLVGGAIPFYLFFTGLSQVPAINAVLIQKTLVVWVVLLATIFLKERITKTQALAVCLLFAGNLFVGGFQGFKYSTGELMIMLATILWAVESVLVKKLLPTIDSDVVATFRMGFGSLLLMGATYFTVPNAFSMGLHMTPLQMFWVTATVLFLFFYVTFWYRALKLASAITVSAVLVSSTLVTNTLSAIFITHTWNGTLMIQAIMLLIGVGLYYRGSIKKVTVATSN